MKRFHEEDELENMEMSEERFMLAHLKNNKIEEETIDNRRGQLYDYEFQKKVEKKFTKHEYDEERCHKCHRYASCINGICVCQQGLNGDGIRKCTHNVPVIKGVFPIKPQIGSEIIVSFNETPHVTAPFPSCKFDEREINATFQNSLFICKLPKPKFWILDFKSKYEVRASVDSISWSEPFSFEVESFIGLYTSVLAKIKKYVLYTLAFSFGFGFVFFVYFVTDTIRRNKIKLINPFEADVLYA